MSTLPPIQAPSDDFPKIWSRTTACAVALMFACLFSGALSALEANTKTEEAPPFASKLGYNIQTFSSIFDNDMDVLDSRTTGYNWYLAKWFGWRPTKRSALAFDQFGSLILDGDDGVTDYLIGTAGEIKSGMPDEWVGKAFGGGGYFEAEFKFDPRKVVDKEGSGFPSWWMEPLEHMATPRRDQWIGEASGYEHFVEIDIFEYNQWKKFSPKVYSGAVHDWHGLHAVTCPPNFCDISNFNGRWTHRNAIITPPLGTNFEEFHKYGIVWVPATDENEGFIEYYFDRMPTDDKVSWKKYRGDPPSAETASWVFAVADLQHFVLIFGTETNKPMTIKSVHVWQKSTDDNIER